MVAPNIGLLKTVYFPGELGVRFGLRQACQLLVPWANSIGHSYPVPNTPIPKPNT